MFSKIFKTYFHVSISFFNILNLSKEQENTQHTYLPRIFFACFPLLRLATIPPCLLHLLPILASPTRLLSHSFRDLPRTFTTPLYCKSLTSVRSPKPAYPYRVSGFIVHVAALLFLWLKPASTVMRACPDSLSVLARAISSLSIEVVGDWPIGSLIGFAFQPARVPSYPVAVTPTRVFSSRLEPGVCGCGPCICGMPSASQSQWSETAREVIAFHFNPALGFAVGVCKCVTLCCTHCLVSREIIVAGEQLRSWPEGFRLIRQPLRS